MVDLVCIDPTRFGAIWPLVAPILKSAIGHTGLGAFSDLERCAVRPLPGLARGQEAVRRSAARYQSWGDEVRRVNRQFLAARAVAPLLDWPPESVPVRRILKSMFEGTGTNPNVLWNWHSRYYAGSIKTKIVYEAYPASQDEVDAMASKLGLPRVLYDP